MPWLPILMALITFLTAKKKGNASNATAAAAAAAAGLGTYYVETQTEWGKSTLGAIDGSINDMLGLTGSGEAPKGATKRVVDGQTVVVPVPKQGTSSSTGSWADGVWSTLQSWGPTGTAAVIGTTGAVATGKANWLVYGGIAIAAILLLK